MRGPPFDETVWRTVAFEYMPTGRRLLSCAATSMTMGSDISIARTSLKLTVTRLS